MEGTTTQYNQMFNAQATTPVEPETEVTENVEAVMDPEVEIVPTDAEATPAPEPEAEAAPEVAPVVAPTPVRRVGRVNAENNLNIRKQPNTNAGVVCVAKAGEELKISTWNNPDWYRVSTANGRIGYCMKKFVTVE